MVRFQILVERKMLRWQNLFLCQNFIEFLKYTGRLGIYIKKVCLIQYGDLFYSVGEVAT